MSAEHAGEVLAIYRLGMDGGNATFDTECPTWEQFDASRMKDHRFVARDGERVLGWVVLSRTSARPSYRGVAEVTIYVHPEAQGRGVGRALLAAVIDDSERAGFWTLQAGIFPENTASMALHESMGFRVVGVRERVGLHQFQGQATWRDVVMLERRSQAVG